MDADRIASPVQNVRICYRILPPDHTSPTDPTSGAYHPNAGGPDHRQDATLQMRSPKHTLDTYAESHDQIPVADGFYPGKQDMEPGQETAMEARQEKAPDYKHSMNGFANPFTEESDDEDYDFDEFDAAVIGRCDTQDGFESRDEAVFNHLANTSHSAPTSAPTSARQWDDEARYSGPQNDIRFEDTGVFNTHANRCHSTPTSNHPCDGRAYSGHRTGIKLEDIDASGAHANTPPSISISTQQSSQVTGLFYAAQNDQSSSRNFDATPRYTNAPFSEPSSPSGNMEVRSPGQMKLQASDNFSQVSDMYQPQVSPARPSLRTKRLREIPSGDYDVSKHRRIGGDSGDLNQFSCMPGTGTKPALHSMSGPHESSLIRCPNIFTDIDSSRALMPQPTFKAPNNRKRALDEILAAVPDEQKVAARKDAKWFIRSCQSLGRGQIKPATDDSELWMLKGLETFLKPHQVIGSGFMRRLETAQSGLPHGGILADQMGLGKTLETLACVVNDCASGCTLIVTPASIKDQWFNEISVHCTRREKAQCSNKFRPGIGKVMIYNSTTEQMTSDAVGDIEESHICLTTYQEVLRSHQSRGALHKCKFRRICLDEAHIIKNMDGKQTKACLALSGEFRWAITGTPTPNSRMELRSLFHFIHHPLKISKKVFSDTSKDWTGLDQALSEIVIRRTHSDTLFGAKLVDLPETHTFHEKLEFTPIEYELYTILYQDLKAFVDSLSKGRRFPRGKNPFVMILITRMRQLSPHPIMVEGVLHQFRGEQALDLLQDLGRKPAYQDERSQRLLCCLTKSLKRRLARDEADTAHVSDTSLDPSFSQAQQTPQCEVCDDKAGPFFQGTCSHMFCHVCADMMESAAADLVRTTRCELCGSDVQEFTAYHTRDATTEAEATTDTERSIKKNPVEGDISDWLDEHGRVWPSPKSKFAETKIAESLRQDPSTKIIVYTQWRGMLNVIANVCEERGWGYCRHFGAMTQHARGVALKKFRADPQKRVLIATLQTGSLGLNLTMARVVINLDPWWNEAVESQAFCRVYRIAQTKDTTLFSCTISDPEGTIEDRMLAIKAKKESITDGLLKSYSYEDHLRLFGDEPDDSDVEDVEDVEGAR